MMLPSLYKSSETDHTWNVAHAACYGAVIGLLAAIFKIFGPLRAGAPFNLFGNLTEIVLAAIAFALLCVAAAALRNYVVRRLIRYES
jgi:cbb3-type cytochrome oxidase subunit 1